MENKKNILLYPFVILLAACLLTACGERGPHEALFQEVETIVNERPDSALALLETIERPETLPEREWAYWALFTTQAKDKLYIRHTSDSIINRVVDYFDDFAFFRYRHEKALAYYYQGRINSDLGDLKKALMAYLKASDNAKWTGDHKLIYRIESHTGKIYILQNSYHLAYNAFKKAAEAARLTNDSTSIAYSSIYLARVSGEEGNWEKAKSFYKDAIDIADQIENIQVSFYGTKELAAVYTEVDSLDMALVLAKRAFASESKYGIPHDWSLDLTIGDIYRKTRQTDSADYYLNQAIKSSNIYTRRSAYKALYALYEEIRPEVAVKYNAFYEASLDSIKAMGTSSDSYQIHEDQNTKTWKLEKAWGIALIVVISLLLIYLFNYFLRYKRKSKKELEESQSEKQQMAEHFNETSTQMANRLLESESRCKDLEKGKISAETKGKEKDNRILYLENQLEATEDLAIQVRKGEKIVLELKKNLHALPDTKDRDYVLAFVDVTNENFVLRLKYRFPKMKRADLEYAAFVRLGFSLHDLEIILGIGIRSVSRRKNNVKNCVKSELPKGMDVDDFLKNF